VTDGAGDALAPTLAPREPRTEPRTTPRTRNPVRRVLGRMRLATQFAVLGAAVITAVVVGSFAAVQWQLRQTTRDRFTAEVARTQRTLLRLQQRELAQRLLTASLVSEAPALHAAVETWRTERTAPLGGASLGASAGTNPHMQAQLRATLQQAVERQLEGTGAALVVLTDAGGVVLAAAARAPAVPRPGESLARVPFVRRALDPQAVIDGGNVGVVRLGDGWFSAAAAPVLVDGWTIGSVVLGERIDEAWVRTLQAALDGHIVARAGGRVIGSTLEDSAAGALPDVGDGTGTVAVAGEEYVAATYTLGTAQDGERVVLWMLHPFGRAVRDFTGAVARDFFLFGLLAIVVAAAGAAVGARAMLAPLRRIVTLLREGARTGTFRPAHTPAGAPREIRYLSHSYAQLADALEGERDAVRRRTAELESANDDLTQQVRERVRVERALHEREEQLRQAQKLEALGTLAGGVAHDFNNLLTVISGFTELALVTMPRDDRSRGDLLQVKDAAHRAGELTGQLLAFGRRQVLQPRVVDLNESVERIHAMLGRLVGRHLTIAIETTKDLARVHADPGQLEQVLMNLAINARDAMPDGGTLTIGTANVADGVALIVRDTGHGMDAATRARIFEPFFTTKEQGKGTGLGLATVYGIVQQSGGRITVESAPGAGTTFTIILPAVAAADVVEAPDDATDAAPRGAEVVLLVEDEPQVRALAARILADHGYRVLEACEGREALRIAERHPGIIDLLLTDVVMPRMTGHELARRLRLARPETRVLFMSGHSEEAITLRGDVAAGAAFMRKPFAPETLARTVRGILDAEVLGVVA
jgi:two-component system cell cycle sensor histidine kinase/response regulator CckA